MNEPKQIELFEENTGRPKRQVEYVPPDPAVIKEYAHAVCTELAQKNPAYANQEVVSGFASFLNFVAQTSAKYLNSGHQEYLLKGYKKPSPTRKGVSNGSEKTITQSAA
jgi:hypothetical protein